ncbi:MAG: esterase, partial [Acidobacteria bacterium]|nr:esterase [Acidobacteriota bacterium]
MRPLLPVFPLCLATLLAQPPAPLISPEVHPDSRVTFRLRAPSTQKVELRREGAAAVAMEKDESGVWSVTVGP